MKNQLLLTLLLAFVGLSTYAQTTETLTNESIITLTKIGLQPSVIVTKINSSNANFDVSTDALINLSNNKVASEVINTMMNATEKQKEEGASIMDSKDPNDMHKSGVYYYNATDPTPLMKILANRVTYQTSSGGYGGYGGSSTTAHLGGLESKLRISQAQPIFYFYFEKKASSNDWYQSSDPSEFDLVKLIPKKITRYFKVGGSSSGMMSSSQSSGIPQDLKIPFDYSEVSEGIYKITFKTPLKPGDYCFVFSGNTYKVFDFGVDKP